MESCPIVLYVGEEKAKVIRILQMYSSKLLCCATDAQFLGKRKS